MTKAEAPLIRRACFHEAGHAAVAHHFDIPIRYVRLRVKRYGRVILFDGMTEHEVEKLHEDLKSGDSKVSMLAFLVHLAVRWGGMAAEKEFCASGFDSEFAKSDLKGISEDTRRMKGSPEKIKELCSSTALVASDIVRKRRSSVRQLAKELFDSVLANNGLFQMEGQRVARILSESDGDGAD